MAEVLLKEKAPELQDELESNTHRNMDNNSSSKTRRQGQAIRLSFTLSLNHQQWLNQRRQGIGSSDASIAVGLNPYQSALTLWMNKTGRCADTIVKSNEDSPLLWGTILEPIVADEYAQRTGKKVRRVNAILQHPEYPWMLANLDRHSLCKIIVRQLVMLF